MRARGRDRAVQRWASVGASAFLVAASLGVGAAVAHLTAPAADAVDPQGEVLIESTFDDGGFDGWTRATSGRKGIDDDWGTVHTIPWTGGHVQVVQLDGTGGRNHPNSWIFKEVAVPAGAKSLTFDTEGHDRAGADAELRVRVVDSGTSVTLLDEVEQGCEDCKTFHGRSIDISAYAGKTVTFFFEQNDNGSHGRFPGENEQILVDNIRIRGPLPPCDLAGIVRDGQLAGDGHANPLAGVPVTLMQDGNPVAGPVVSESDGHYCIPGGLVDPGDYQLQVDLVDAKHNPSIFKTVHGASDDAVTTKVDVTADDFGRQDVDVSFAATAGQPWLADVAAIHWESARFAEWLVGTLAVDPVTLSGLTIETGSTKGTSYESDPKRVFIQASDTPYEQREAAFSECPENCEWHEMSHHVAAILGIAPTSSAPACVGRVNHGGWTNTTTCDSLSEGFAMFLPTLASLDIDAGRGGGYATPAYSFFGSFEDNWFKPWVTIDGFEKEDFAVAQLLWDLADDTPEEPLTIISVGPVLSGQNVPAQVKDKIAFGIGLVQQLATIQPETVADVYDGLIADPTVAAALKVPDLDVDGDGTADLGPIDEVFIGHGFHPIRSTQDWNTYLVGDSVGETQPGGTNETVRRKDEATPGSAIRVQNSTAAPVTVAIDVAYPETSLHFDVVVGATSERLVHLELPAYWDGTHHDGPLPACGSADPWPVTVTISAPGADPEVVSNCQYLHAIEAATSDAAVTFNIAAAAVASAASATAPPTASPANAGGSSALIVLVGAAIIAAVVAGFVLLRRRRPAPNR